MTCTYTFRNGDVVRGKPALKSYLTQNLASLLPDRAAETPAFSRFPTSAEFKRWFGDSKVVDAKGNPLVVYHGTQSSFDVFDQGWTEMSPRSDASALGFYFTEDKQLASYYARYSRFGFDGNVMPVFLSIRNPYRAEFREDPMWRKATNSRSDAKLVREELKRQGYDGFITPDNELVAFEPTQIKSAIGNNGEYSLTNPDIRFDRTPRQPSAVSTEHSAMVESTVQGITNQWANSPKVEFFSTLQDQNIPQYARDEYARQQAQGAVGEVEGFFVDGTMYIWRGLRTPQDVQRVTFHEGLGHYGLRGVFGEELESVLQQIVNLRKGDVLAKARAYGFDSKSTSDLLMAAEEVLAEMAQTKPEVGFVQRALAAIRSWLRKNVPGMANLELSDAEVIRDFIMPARAFVERGAKEGRDMAGAAFSRVQSPFDGPETAKTPIGDTTQVTVDGKVRPALNANGQPIHKTIEGVRNFWRWFGDSEVVDPEGMPIVFYHGGDTGFTGVRDQGVFGGIFVREGSPSHYRTTQYALYVKGPILQLRSLREELNSAEGRDALEKAVRQNLDDEQAEALTEALTDGGDYPTDELTLELLGAIDAADAQVEIQKLRGEVAKILGYGAVRTPDEFGEETVMITDAGQIKSATDNNGDFKGGNPDIRFSRSAPAPTGLTLPKQKLLRRVQSILQDNFNRVRQVQDRIAEITGQPVPEHANYYGAETQRPGRIAARLEDFEKQAVGPLMERLAKSKHTPEQLSELLHAMHARERNEYVARVNPDKPDGGSGMITADADAILARYRNNRELHRIADQARKIAKAVLELKLSYGLIDNETFTTLSNNYRYYVPLKGDGEYGPRIQRAMGHEERDEHILENLSRDYEQAIVVGEKNLARHSLLSMVLENPDSALWTVGVLPKGRYVAGTVFSVQRNGQEVATFTSQSQVMAFLEAKGPEAGQYTVMANGERVREFVKPLQDNEVPVYVDGQLVRIQIKDEQLAQQLRPLRNQGQMETVLGFMRGVVRYLSKIYTGYNPAFIVLNLFRDIQTGTINILGNEGAGTLVRAWANYPAAMKALSLYASTGKVPAGESGALLNEYRQHGGKTGASWMSDLEEQGKTLQRLYEDAYGATGYLADKRYGKASIVAGRKIVTGMAHVVEVLNQATENGLRLALYMAMRKQGVSPGEAARAAKAVTVDFDRKGTLSPVLGAIYLFFNPAVQGTANAMRTLFKGSHKGQAWTALGALAALGFYAASQGMDDDKDRWLGEGWESRSKNFLLNIGKYTIRVPVSLEFAPFYAFGVAMAEAKMGVQSNLATAGHIVSSFIDAYFPLRGMYIPESDNHAMDAFMAGVPTMLQAPGQIATNRNSFGSQVVPENDLTKNRPDNLKMFRATKGTVFDRSAQGIAEAGIAFGHGRYENDITKVSPETLKLLWRTYTGGLGQFITDTAGLAMLAGSEGVNIEVADVPIVKSFVKVNDVKAIRGRYYDIIKDARDAADEFRQARKAGDADEIDKIMMRPEKAELLGFDRLIKSTNKAVAAIRDEAVDVNADTKMSLAEKRAKLKELEREEEAIYRNAIEAFR